MIAGHIAHLLRQEYEFRADAILRIWRGRKGDYQPTEDYGSSYDLSIH